VTASRRNRRQADPAPGGVPGPPAALTPRGSSCGPDGTVILVLSGDFDAGNAQSLAQRLAEALERRPRRLVIDMAAVGFIDCASARLIVGTGRALPAGARPVIRAPRPVVRRVLQITGLDTLCELTQQPAEGPTA
jgi:anti-sigma B factor antagonist